MTREKILTLLKIALAISVRVILGVASYWIWAEYMDSIRHCGDIGWWFSSIFIIIAPYERWWHRIVSWVAQMCLVLAFVKFDVNEWWWFILIPFPYVSVGISSYFGDDYKLYRLYRKEMKKELKNKKGTFAQRRKTPLHSKILRWCTIRPFAFSKALISKIGFLFAIKNPLRKSNKGNAGISVERNDGIIPSDKGMAGAQPLSECVMSFHQESVESKNRRYGETPIRAELVSTIKWVGGLLIGAILALCACIVFCEYKDETSRYQKSGSTLIDTETNSVLIRRGKEWKWEPIQTCEE